MCMRWHQADIPGCRGSHTPACMQHAATGKHFGSVVFVFTVHAQPPTEGVSDSDSVSPASPTRELAVACTNCLASINKSWTTCPYCKSLASGDKQPEQPQQLLPARPLGEHRVQVPYCFSLKAHARFLSALCMILTSRLLRCIVCIELQRRQLLRQVICPASLYSSWAFTFSCRWQYLLQACMSNNMKVFHEFEPIPQIVISAASLSMHDSHSLPLNILRHTTNLAQSRQTYGAFESVFSVLRAVAETRLTKLRSWHRFDESF
jgi:hypothetical protein